ncbi:hypothetical protein UF15_07650 [Bacillus sp. L_1B0_12]|nr:hypothetical protein UF15_07650 [Bacillus sp. L_1B0_12]
MLNVVIADDRPLWVQKEDKLMACMTRCKQYKYCSSRFGADCKRMGGVEIPKIGGRKHERKA